MTPQERYRGDTPLERLVALLADSSRRQFLLIGVAYVTGGLGLATVFLSELWLSVRAETATLVSILLMSVSFLSLFLVSISAPGVDDG